MCWTQQLFLIFFSSLSCIELARARFCRRIAWPDRYMLSNWSRTNQFDTFHVLKSELINISFEHVTHLFFRQRETVTTVPYSQRWTPAAVEHSSQFFEQFSCLPERKSGKFAPCIYSQRLHKAAKKHDNEKTWENLHKDYKWDFRGCLFEMGKKKGKQQTQRIELRFIFNFSASTTGAQALQVQFRRPKKKQRQRCLMMMKIFLSPMIYDYYETWNLIL